MNELELVMNELELGSGSLELGTGSLELGSFTPLQALEKGLPFCICPLSQLGIHWRNIPIITLVFFFFFFYLWYLKSFLQNIIGLQLLYNFCTTPTTFFKINHRICRTRM